MPDQVKDQLKLIIDEELGDLKHLTSVLTLNINRALTLLHESARLREHTDDMQVYLEYMYDILRATVVFLHSALETALRDVVRLKLQHDNDLSISRIPLAGRSRSLARKEKFSLEDLAKHRGKTVDEVINESIDRYLSVLSFNNTDDIAATFIWIGLPESTLKQYYSDLNDMIRRRHQIVHEADLVRDQSSYELEPLDPDKVRVWIKAFESFIVEVIHLVLEAIYVDRIVERAQESGVQVNRQEISESIAVKIRRQFQNTETR